jgi:glycosyltransferase involved in cell wall biosynthesis
MNRYCLVMPVYNHAMRLPDLVVRLSAYHLPCYLVDDGSNEACKQVIAKIVANHAFVRLVTLAENSGKGVAVTTGLKVAAQAGFTHAIQIDSDGQHSPAHLADFIAKSDAFPQRVVSGFRPYALMPDGRRRGRYLTDFCVRINTLSAAIRH